MRKWQCEDVRADRRLAGGRGWWWRNVWSERREGLHCMDIRSNVELLGIFQRRWEYNIQVNSVAMLIHRSSVYIYLSVGRGVWHGHNAIWKVFEKCCDKHTQVKRHRSGLLLSITRANTTRQNGIIGPGICHTGMRNWRKGSCAGIILDKIKCNMMIRADANLAGYRLQILRL